MFQFVKYAKADSHDEGLSYFNELVEFVRTYNPEYAKQTKRQLFRPSDDKIVEVINIHWHLLIPQKL